MKRLALWLLICSMLLTLLTGCGKNADSGSSKGSEDGGLSGYLTVATNASGGVFDSMQELIDEFCDLHPGVEIEYTSYGADYENLMKAKMAANDLPDVFATHGWSTRRYAEYLEPLNDMSFVSDLTEMSQEILSDGEGNIYVLPMTLDMAGVLYNKTVLQELGCEIPTTWEEFFEVCQVAKDNGIIPIYIAGKDDRCMAVILNHASLPYLVSDENNNYRTQLLDGTFDWSNWTSVAQLLIDMKEYANTDCVTADFSLLPEKLASGEVLFNITGNYVIPMAEEINPDVQLGFFPLPAASEADEPVVAVMEREAYGIWKDSENKELAYALLEFLAQPENVKKVCEASGQPTAFSTVECDFGNLNEDYAAAENFRAFTTFDVGYLPSGMYPVMRTVGASLLAGDCTAEEAAAVMQENYDKLISQAN